jgi:L-amino acid N-acyltransferase YncA
MIHIRRANSEDAPFIVQGINQVCTEGGAFVTDRFVPTPTWQSVLQSPEQLPNHLVVVAEFDGVFAGSGRLFPGPAHSYYQHVVELGMFVLPPFRQKGIGRALLKWMCDWADSQSYERITLAVFAKNQAAFNLYQSTGFIEEGRMHKQIMWEGVFDDLILMARMSGSA